MQNQTQNQTQNLEQNKNQKQASKKEPLSLMTVKIFLTVVIFAGVGTIIVGGGYIVWEYSKNSNNNKIIKTIEENQKEELATYCETDSDCKGYLSYNTCETFCANKNEKNQKMLDELEAICDPTLWFATKPECECVDNKCVDIGFEKEEKCAKAGEFVNPDNLKGKTNYPDVCCEGLKGVNAYKVNEDGECEVIIGTPYLTCVPCGDGVCEEVGLWFENKCNCPEDCGEEIDTSDWQTYQNEEFGFKVKYPEGFSAVSLDQTKNNLNPFYQNWIQFIFEREYFGSPIAIVTSDKYIDFVVVHINKEDKGSECFKNDFLIGKEGKTINKETTTEEVISESDFYKEEWREGMDASHFLNYRTVYNDKCFMITTNLEDSYPSDSVKMELYDKIIHSFKFIEN